VVGSNQSTSLTSRPPAILFTVDERSGSGANSRFAAVLAVLLATGWVANHFVALIVTIVAVRRTAAAVPAAARDPERSVPPRQGSSARALSWAMPLAPWMFASGRHYRCGAGRARLRVNRVGTADHDGHAEPAAVAGSGFRVGSFAARRPDRGSRGATTPARHAHRNVLCVDLHRLWPAAAIDHPRVWHLADNPRRYGGACVDGSDQPSGTAAARYSPAELIQPRIPIRPLPLCAAGHRQPVLGCCPPRSTRPGAAMSGWRCG
jgi:hypothetical protein